MNRQEIVLAVGLFCTLMHAAFAQPAWPSGKVRGVTSASGTAAGWSSDGPIDGELFAIKPQNCWRGDEGAKSWSWQVRFAPYGKSVPPPE